MLVISRSLRCNDFSYLVFIFDWCGRMIGLLVEFVLYCHYEDVMVAGRGVVMHCSYMHLCFQAPLR